MARPCLLTVPRTRGGGPEDASPDARPPAMPPERLEAPEDPTASTSAPERLQVPAPEMLQSDVDPEMDMLWENIGGRKVRRYKNTTRPPGIDPDAWRTFAVNTRKQLTKEWREECDRAAGLGPSIETKGQSSSSAKAEMATVALPLYDAPAVPARKMQEQRCIVEVCCSSNSLIGKLADSCCEVIRITEEDDFTTDKGRAKALTAVRKYGVDTLVWISIPCTGGSPWQNLNKKRKSGLVRLRQHHKLFKQLWLSAVEVAHEVRNVGGRVAIEWPRNCAYWRWNCVRKLAKEMGFRFAKFDGCAFGLKDPEGVPMRKPWMLATDDDHLHAALADKTCPGHAVHRKVEGELTKATENYTEELVNTVHLAWRESIRSRNQKMCASSPSANAPDHSHISLNSPIPAMPTQSEIHPHRPRNDNWGFSLVARPVSKSEIESEPEAKDSMDSEWNRLKGRGTWDEKGVQEWWRVSGDARRRNQKVHVGRIFGICVEKGSELPKIIKGRRNKLRKYKGRFVFEGSNVRDEFGRDAVFGDLSSSPATLEAAKAVDAFGLIAGNTIEQSDAEQAYVQARLKGTPTWVRLPRDRWPPEWEGMTDPVVPLRLALYGHPDSGGYWEKHCEEQLRKVGFFPVPLWGSMFYHPGLQLLLMVYVDDFKMAGSQHNLERGWKLMREHISMDEPVPVNRCLGCLHKIHREKTSTGFRKVIEYDMEDFMSDCVKQYLTLAQVPEGSLRPAATPFLEDSISDASPKGDKDSDKGVLQPIACRVLMKILYGARLARFDLLRAVGALASNVATWDRSCDRKLHRLVAYINSTKGYRMTGYCSESATFDSLSLELFADADFAGCPRTVRSTSGTFLALKGEGVFIPLSASSKRQSCVSHSTTEAEVVAANTAVRAVGIPAKHFWEYILNRPVEMVLREDNQATICVIKNGYSPALRHMPRTHRVSVAWLSELIQEEEVDVQYCDTNEQAADIFTKPFTGIPKWRNALQLIGSGPSL